MGLYEGAVQVVINAIAQAQMLRDDDLIGAAKSAVRAYQAGMAEWEVAISAGLQPSTSEAGSKDTVHQHSHRSL